MQQHSLPSPMFVIGRLGEEYEAKLHTIGSHIENMIRAIHAPILIAVGSFQTPENFMIAYDGSETADKAISRIAQSPLLKGLQG